eukprot:gene20163-22138_t
MDDLMNDRIDYDYHIEEDSETDSSSDEEAIRAFEECMEQLENELNTARDGESGNENQDGGFEMDDKLYTDGHENENEGNQEKSDSNQCGQNENKDEDFLYDPDLDDEDEEWMEKERQKYRVKKDNVDKSKSKEDSAAKDKETKPFRSDAILSCPACMTTVCIDCQRHAVYKTQYRAMFVMNCEVGRDEVLRYEEKKHKKKSFNPGHLVSASEDNGAKSELYNPVKCTECGTVIAVYDVDEIYHFFNILASQA